MCRTASVRRCPSHSDPVAIVARNARRRAAYALRKSGAQGTAAAGAARVLPPFHNLELEGFSGEGLLPIHRETTALENLNISVHRQSGYLVELGYLAPQVARGTINHGNVDGDSYREFGFDAPNGDGYYRSGFFDGYTMEKISRCEMEQLSTDEQLAARFFTTSNYSWLNEALYARSGRRMGGDLDCQEQCNREQFGVFTEENRQDVSRSAFRVPLEYRTAETVEGICAVLDRAMENAPKYNRKLYRGMAADSDAALAAGGVDNWLSENISLGGEVVFDGYQSTTVSLRNASSYAEGDGAIIYEVHTPEGINVTGLSRYSDEVEVILPRQSRYMVVGLHRNVARGPQSNRGCTVVQLVAINGDGEILDGTNASPRTTPFPLEMAA